jgi:hypothetical protein
MTGVKGQKWKTTRPPKRRKVGIAIKQNLYDLIEEDAKKLDLTTSRIIEIVMVKHYVGLKRLK